MGRVFTAKAMKANKVPHRDAFLSTAEIIRQGLGESPHVLAALIHGSFQRGDYNERSDIDVVLVYEYRYHQHVVALQEHLQKVGLARCVPIRIILTDRESATRGDHTFFPMYHEHLRASAALGGIVKCDPNNFICPMRMTYRAEVHGYLTRKANAFDQLTESLPGATPEDVARGLGKVLSFPTHAARKMLQYLKPDYLIESDSQRAVRGLYPSLGIDEAQEVFTRLTALDRMYSEELVDQLNHPDPASYRLVLKELLSAIELARRFARLNLIALR